MNLAIVLYIFVVTLQGVNGKAYSDFKDKAENDTDIEGKLIKWKPFLQKRIENRNFLLLFRFRIVKEVIKLEFGFANGSA